LPLLTGFRDILAKIRAHGGMGMAGRAARERDAKDAKDKERDAAVADKLPESRSATSHRETRDRDALDRDTRENRERERDYRDNDRVERVDRDRPRPIR
jgi:hypothetical protein